MSQWLNTKIKSKLDDCRSGESSTKVSCKSTELKHRVVTYRHAETEMSLCRIKQRHHTVGGPATDQNIQCGHIKDCKLSTTTGGKLFAARAERSKLSFGRHLPGAGIIKIDLHLPNLS